MVIIIINGNAHEFQPRAGMAFSGLDDIVARILQLAGGWRP
jgi:hypothetical protein